MIFLFFWVENSSRVQIRACDLRNQRSGQLDNMTRPQMFTYVSSYETWLEPPSIVQMTECEGVGLFWLRPNECEFRVINRFACQHWRCLSAIIYRTSSVNTMGLDEQEVWKKGLASKGVRKRSSQTIITTGLGLYLEWQGSQILSSSTRP